MELSKGKSFVVSSLSSAKMRRKHGLFVAEGEKCVMSTIGGFELNMLVATPEWIERNKDFCGGVKERLATASTAVMDKISSLSTPPEVLAVFHIPHMEMPELSPDGLYLILDGIQDPGNLGTIIRTADWFGIDTIIASRDTVDVFNPKTVQSTMGSLKRVKVVYTDLVSLIESYPGMKVYGTLLDGKNIYGTPLENHGFIIMGNEGKGISESVREKIDSPLLIPPYNNGDHPESLNVAAATAVVLSCFRSKR